MKNIDYILVNKSEIARRLGVTPAYICAIASGKRKATRMRALIAELVKKELRAA